MKEQYFRQPPTEPKHFAGVPSAEIPRSVFDRSHGHKTTFDHGQLVPVYLDEIVPGDTFDMKSTAFVRLATPLKPIMDNIYLDIHYFFVPNRLLWDKWPEFMGERKNPTDDNTDLVIPQADINISTLTSGRPSVRMGIPMAPGDATPTIKVNALPFRAYNLIYNEWYRDQNLSNPAAVNTGDDGTVDEFTCITLSRAKRRDYFTSCLPWPQKGDPVFIPLADTAPVMGTGTPPYFHTATGPNVTLQATYPNTTKTVAYSGASDSSGADFIFSDDQTGLFTDLSAATAITINDLRIAFQVQKLLERDARGGTRYIELILSHFGVRSDDARLQRPEYLGGGTSFININPVSTTFLSTEVALGDLGANATSVQTAGFSKSFTEHGYIMGIMSTRADLTYQNGLERHWLRQSRYGYYWPAFAHLGEQSVLKKEIYATGDPLGDTVFGYQERWSEMRYKQSRLSGKFLSRDPESLDVWHLAQDLASTAALNDAFVKETGIPMDRIIAVQGEPHYLADIYFSLKCTRPLPTYSVPGLIDHF